jgi:hypothetical protein
MAKDGGGKGAVAYYVDGGCISCRDAIPRLFLRTWYDCDGKPFGPWRTWECFVLVGDQWVNIPIEGYGLLGSTGQSGKGILNDGRTLKMMALGCCPPELMKDFVMTEGGAFAEADAAEEALKLHKRGYFGGGG